MKRSNNVEVAEPPDASCPTKKQKVATENDIDGDNDAVRPQLDYMPKIAATPPAAPLTEEEELELKRKYRHAYKIPPPKTYRPRDYALWPQIATNVYRQQVNIRNHTHASAYIRVWFAEHAGLRAPPPKAPRSAYSVYFNKQKSVWAATHGTFSQAKDTKKIGAMWRALAEEDKRTWHDTYDRMVAQFNANDEFWQAEAEAWGEAKLKELQEKGEETDPERRMGSKLPGLSAENFYYYKWW